MTDHSLKLKNIEFIIQGKKEISKKLLSNAADIFSTMNQFLTNENKINTVVISSEGAILNKGIKITIPERYFLLPKEVTSAYLWHEAVHSFDLQIHKNNKKDWDYFVELFFEFEKFGNMDEGDKLFGLFDESNYLDVDSKMGHPYDSPRELFASASTILKFFPKEFMENVSKLSEKEKELVIKVAHFVVKKYFKHPNYKKGIFDSKLLNYLNLEEKKPLLIN